MSPQEVVESVGIPAHISPHATLGFHGTDAQHVPGICGEGFTSARCRLGLFGRGPYFYEDNAPNPGLDAALDFVNFRRNFPTPTVLCADVSLERAFDMIGFSSNQSLFNELQKKLVDLATSQDPHAVIDDRKIGSATITFISRHCPEASGMQGVRAEFSMKNLPQPRQNGLCVLDCGCIQNVRQC